jgi:hypothetical protein
MAEDESKSKADESKRHGTQGWRYRTCEYQRNESTDLVAADDDFFAEGGGGLSRLPAVRLSHPLRAYHSGALQGASEKSREVPARCGAGDVRQLGDSQAVQRREGFLVIPGGFGHSYMAWRPNNAGPAYDMGDDPTKVQRIDAERQGKRIDSEGNELTDALQYSPYSGRPRDSNEWEAAVLNFSGSQAKQGSRMGYHDQQSHGAPVGHPEAGQLFRPSMWFYSYKITTVPESNDKGSWYGFSIEEGPKVKDLPNGRRSSVAASELRKRIEANEVKAAMERDRDDDAPRREGVLRGAAERSVENSYGYQT